MRVRVALFVGLALCAIALGLTLLGSPARVAATNGVFPDAAIPVGQGRKTVCQLVRTLPQDTSALRFSMFAVIGPSIDVTIHLGKGVLASGTRGSGWTGGDVTVPVPPINRTVSRARICIQLGAGREPISLLGDKAPLRMRIEFLTPEKRSWWALALPIARRLGLGRAPSGTWVAVLLAMLMATVGVLAALVCIRGSGDDPRPARSGVRHRGSSAFGSIGQAFHRVPTAAWICALIACLNGVCWSIVSPPFQTPDEPDHFAYVQRLAETHQLPSGSSREYSEEEQTVLEDLHGPQVRFRPGEKTIASHQEEDTLEHDLARGLSKRSHGSAGVATSEPPLYYALASVPYVLGSDGSLLDRLELIRILSALLGGLTALFAFLFVREALPGAPWAWPIGGLGVALSPLLGVTSGAVNPDAMLSAVSALLFYLLARAFRRRLTPRLALAIGTVAAVGLLTKLNFLGLAPGLLLGVLVLSRREWQRGEPAAFRSLGIALACAMSPAILYVLVGALTHRSSLRLLANDASDLARSHALLPELSYIWQLYLPRLPAMTSYFPEVSTWRQLWFNGLVGMYGWADILFPAWFCTAALLPAGFALLLLLRALARARTALTGRVGELLTYGTIGVGVLALVGAASYTSDVLGEQGPFWEPRYLLPLIPLFGVGVALAARGAGRRWGPVVGVLLVVLVLGHDLASQLLVISRYYA